MTTQVVTINPTARVEKFKELATVEVLPGNREGLFMDPTRFKTNLAIEPDGSLAIHHIEGTFSNVGTILERIVKQREEWLYLDCNGGFLDGNANVSNGQKMIPTEKPLENRVDVILSQVREENRADIWQDVVSHRFSFA